MKCFKILGLALGIFFFMQTSIMANVPSFMQQQASEEVASEVIEKRIFFLGVKDGKDFFEMVKEALLDLEETLPGVKITILERALNKNIWSEFEKISKQQNQLDFDCQYFETPDGRKEKLYIIFLR